jgi:hypothetical protein
VPHARHCSGACAAAPPTVKAAAGLLEGHEGLQLAVQVKLGQLAAQEVADAWRQGRARVSRRQVAHGAQRVMAWSCTETGAEQAHKQGWKQSQPLAPFLLPAGDMYLQALARPTHAVLPAVAVLRAAVYKAQHASKPQQAGSRLQA